MSGRWLYAWGLAAMAFGGASLLVPLYVVELGGDAFTLGILFASASFVGVPGALASGSLADRTGRRGISVLGAMATAVATMLAMPLLEAIAPVVVANAVLWFGFSAAAPVLTVLVVAGEPEEAWAARIARLNRVQGLGWALGLGLGFVVVSGGTALVEPIAAQRGVFLACAVCVLFGLGHAVRTLPPDPAVGGAPTADRLRRSVRKARRFNVRGAAFPFTPGRFDTRRLHPRLFLERFTPRLGTYFLAVFLAFTGFGVFFAPLPAYLSTIGHGPGDVFALYLVVNLSAAVFYGVAATLAGRYDTERVHVAGLLARGVSFPLIAAVGVVLGGSTLGVAAVTLVFFAVGLSWAVIAVTAATLVTKLSPVAIRGESLGVYGALVAIGGGVGGLLGGWLAGLGYGVAFGAAGGLVLLGASVVLLLSRRSVPSTTSTPGSG